jgi:hypothetical protein
MTETTLDLRTIHDLAEALAAEGDHYRRLLDLARRQGELMTRHEVQELEIVARRMTEGLAAADVARIRRERLAGAAMAAVGAAASGSLGAWLQTQPESVRAILDGPVRSVRRTAGELARANEMNRRLANFCLDLVEEEASVLRQCLLDDPAGRYDSGARPATKEQGGVLRRQA